MPEQYRVWVRGKDDQRIPADLPVDQYPTPQSIEERLRGMGLRPAEGNDFIISERIPEPGASPTGPATTTPTTSTTTTTEPASLLSQLPGIAANVALPLLLRRFGVGKLGQIAGGVLAPAVMSPLGKHIQPEGPTTAERILPETFWNGLVPEGAAITATKALPYYRATAPRWLGGANVAKSAGEEAGVAALNAYEQAPTAGNLMRMEVANRSPGIRRQIDIKGEEALKQMHGESWLNFGALNAGRLPRKTAVDTAGLALDIRVPSGAAADALSAAEAAVAGTGAKGVRVWSPDKILKLAKTPEGMGALFDHINALDEAGALGMSGARDNVRSVIATNLVEKKGILKGAAVEDLTGRGGLLNPQQIAQNFHNIPLAVQQQVWGDALPEMTDLINVWGQGQAAAGAGKRLAGLVKPQKTDLAWQTIAAGLKLVPAFTGLGAGVYKSHQGGSLSESVAAGSGTFLATTAAMTVTPMLIGKLMLNPSGIKWLRAAQEAQASGLAQDVVAPSLAKLFVDLGLPALLQPPAEEGGPVAGLPTPPILGPTAPPTP